MSELEIIDGTNHLDEVKRLVIEYTEFLGRDLSFQSIDDELSDLSAKYTPPEGRLLCAAIDGKIIGCVACHKHNADRCEMKRLFVREGYREHHAGSKLVAAIIDFARTDGFKEIVLDTIKPLVSAIRLYKKFFFVECAPYDYNPMDDVIYMRKNLKMLRIENDFTQEQMAIRLGVTRTTYCNIENGKSKGSMDFWLAVKRAFPEVDIEDMTKVREEA